MLRLGGDVAAERKGNKGKDRHVTDAINERGLHSGEAYKGGGKHKEGGSYSDMEGWRQKA